MTPLFKIKSKLQKKIDSDKIEDLISKLTLEEKAALCSGKDVWNTKSIHRLQIPSIAMADGPHGVRKQLLMSDNIGLFDSIPSTCFPTASAMASTWNRNLIREVGIALAQECRHGSISMLLGPGINIKRSPLCGRNFEYFSEDPYLSAELGISMVNGIQSRGVSACLKHFAVNNQEKYRMTIDAIVDERALNEIYLYAFKQIISEANPWAVMISYNKLNGEYISESTQLAKKILRQEWGYEGVVVTDWGATNDRVLALKAGVDLEMPSSGKIHDPLIIEAIKTNFLPVEILNDSIRRNLTLLFRTKDNQIANFRYSSKKHHLLAKKVASESIVLLKNESTNLAFSPRLDIPSKESKQNLLLPLKPGISVALIGQFAKHPRYQGAGSSHVNPTQLENLYHIAKSDLKDKLTYSKGYSRNPSDNDLHLLIEAKDFASKADVVILMVGLTEAYESEGFDRIHMKLPIEHETLIQEILSIHSNVIVVLSNGAPVEMPWADKVPCIVESYLSGQAGASALWDVLTGKVNPSGKIAESFPLSLEQTSSYPYYPMGPESVEYRESIFVGYRFYEKFNQGVLFPFGHGLSYTSFVYSDMSVENPFFDYDIKSEYHVSLTIENSGKYSGMEVIQLYISDVTGRIICPAKELKGFEKVFLKPKEKAKVWFYLNKSDFSYYSTSTHNFEAVDGNHKIIIGSSSRDIRLESIINLRSHQLPNSLQSDQDLVLNNLETNYYNRLFENHQTTRSEFYQFLDKPMPLDLFGPYVCHLNTTIGACQNHWYFRLIYRVIMHKIKKLTKGNVLQQEAMKSVLLEMPLRGLALMSNGNFTYKHLDALVLWLNRKRIEALKTFFFHK